MNSKISAKKYQFVFLESQHSELITVAPSLFDGPNCPFRCCVHNCRAVRSARIKPEVAGGGVAEIQNGVETCAKTHITQNLNTSPPIHTHTNTYTYASHITHHERVYSGTRPRSLENITHLINLSPSTRIWLITVGARNQNSLFARVRRTIEHTLSVMPANGQRNQCCCSVCR